jgi:HAD superfamily hydrolase (TIGR01450 family)
MIVVGHPAGLPGTASGAAPGIASGAPAPLSGSPVALADRFDVALLDLDGVVYRGRLPVPYAAAAIAAAGERGMRSAYVTNNALRPPEAVAERLTRLGVPARPDEIVTSAQAAARLLVDRLGVGATVLVAGGEGLRRAVAAMGLEPVASADPTPAAVVVGYDPEITYSRLAEAALALRAGAWWVASNTDLTVPTERGLLPGNGAAVAFLSAVTGRNPEVAGKPELAMHTESVRRSAARRPVIVGDRLDTDIEAGFRSRTSTLLVLTGVTSLDDVLAAPVRHRPTYLAADLRGLLRPHPAARLAETGTRLGGSGTSLDDTHDAHEAVCGRWVARVREGTLTWRSIDEASRDSVHATVSADGSALACSDDGLDAARAACVAAWAAADADAPVPRLPPLPS